MKSKFFLGLLALASSSFLIQVTAKADISLEQQQLIEKQVKENQTDYVSGQLIIGMATNSRIDLSKEIRSNLFGIHAKVIEDLSLRVRFRNKSF
jgi:hypothetical protein